jgi:hypothetical protein
MDPEDNYNYSLDDCPPEEFAGPSMSATHFTEVEARTAMTARTEAAAAQMCDLPPRVFARQSRLLGELHLAYYDVSHQAPPKAAALQRFEMLLRAYDSELEGMLKALALVTAAVVAVTAAIGAGGTDDATDAWAAAGGAVRKVVKARRTMPHAFVECSGQVTELKQLWGLRPRAQDSL